MESNTVADASDRESSDEHYTRIQEMIDSLIKDADLALNSKPGQCSSRDPMVSPDQLSSVSTVFDEQPHPPLTDYTRRPAFKGSDCPSDLRYPRPASALGSSPRLSRSRKHKPYVTTAARPSAGRMDPEEADAESDSEFGAASSFSHHGRHTTRQHHRMHRRRNSSSYSDRHADSSQWTGRQRSDTMDSFLSHSSETCVSPGNRMSREFCRPSLPPLSPYAQSHSLADSLCTPTRATFGFEEVGHYDELRMSSRPHGGPSVHQFPALPHDDAHQRSQRWLDVGGNVADRSPYHRYHYHPQQQALFSDDREFRSPTSPATEGSSRGNVPLIRRLRNSVTRAVLRSASFVDDSINDDIAAHADATRHMTPTSTGRPSFRGRSNTSASEISTVVAPGPLSGMMMSFAQCESPTNPRVCNSCIGNPLHQHVDAPRSLPQASQSPPSLWTRRNHGGAGRNEHDRGSPPLFGLHVDRNAPACGATTNNHVRLPDSIEEYDSSCEGKALQPSPTTSHGGSESGLALHTADDSGGSSGLISMISLLYWTLLFTLGALMLDSFLCQVAGKRVMGTVDKIAQQEANAMESSQEGSERREKSVGEAQAQRPRRSLDASRGIAGDGVNVVNTVGRFVRWYIEGPEDPLPPAAANIGGLGGSSNRPPAHSLRARKSQALRGSFKHVE
ncbi:hypothetical protein IWW38_002088 [Coemansia aciculifera]|uniref:Uncharacterized protein n=1 Tax=Coemansia aciculifera TaxID=417176 RepID=A0ACC1M4X8_9FUNG|nr:hypothetical protein IWW38_002088 [Coemansia aciculifera]